MAREMKMSDVRKRSFVSTMSLFFQSGYSAFLGLAANLVLTILLTPSIFGIYITVLSIISVLNYFSDIGLAASLIQKKELLEDDIKTTFTIQQLLIIFILIFGFSATGFIENFYQLPKEGVFLYWALLLSFFISSLKTIPSIFLEREIKFTKIVFVQIAENTVFYISVMILAFAGFGLKSFTVSVMLRAVTGLVLIYTISFWIPKIGISLKSLKTLLSFGVPFQMSSFLALFKDDLITLYLGKVLGFEGLGYIGWAKKWAEAPVRIIMDNVSRVVFPLIARFQDNFSKIRGLSEKILYYQSSLLVPAVSGIVLLMGPLISIIPNYQKWQPALPLFYIFAASSFIVSFSAPFMNILNGLGKVKITFSFMLIFTLVTWGLTVFLTKTLGLYGFPLAHFIVSMCYFLVLIKAKKIISFQFFAPIYKFITASAIMYFVLYLVSIFIPITSQVFVGLLVVVGGILYFGILHFLFNVNLFSEVKSFYEK